ncbi:MAG: hypothetical protein AABW51_02125 [Nanoarchaeota archaeon]
MTEIQDSLLYMDRYLNQQSGSEEQRAVAEALTGKNGTYEEMEYGSERFRNEMIHLFMKALPTSIDCIRFDPDFKKIENSDLVGILNKIDLTSIIHVGGKIQQISPEAWLKGERGNLSEEYTKLVSNYQRFRKELTAKLS